MDPNVSLLADYSRKRWDLRRGGGGSDLNVQWTLSGATGNNVPILYKGAFYTTANLDKVYIL